MAKCILKRWILTKPTLSVVFMPFKVTGVVLIIAFLSTAFFKFGILIWWFWPFRPPFKSFIYPGLISYTLYSFTFGKLPMYPFNYTCKEGGQSCLHFFGSHWQYTNVTMWWLLSILTAAWSFLQQFNWPIPSPPPRTLPATMMGEYCVCSQYTLVCIGKVLLTSLSSSLFRSCTRSSSPRKLNLGMRFVPA